MHQLRRGTLAAALRALLVPTWAAAPIREIFALFRELVQTKSRSSSRFAETRSKRSNERFACFHLGSAIRLSLLVGLGGLEPPTSRLSGVRSNRLSYKPIIPDQVLFPRPVVEINGIEPLTSCLQSRRSPSWAIPPCLWRRSVGRFLPFATVKILFSSVQHV